MKETTFTDMGEGDLPAGRTEGDETWEQTLRREVPATEVLSHLSPVFMPVYSRALNEAGVL